MRQAVHVARMERKVGMYIGFLWVIEKKEATRMT
jgi:hypothetical protein